MNPDQYLHRIGLDPATVDAPDRSTLRRLQRAHVTSVPFETLAITGDPFGEREGAGVSLDRSTLLEKVVERERGGFCYELNGAFCWLLEALGYDVERVAARVVDDEDDPGLPPANHLALVVSLDRRYLVDVGLGTTKPRRPLAIDGEGVVDEAGVAWRIVESARPDADYRLEAREPTDEEYAVRYRFTDQPRETSYFRASCDYLQTAPESTFTGDPVVALSTDRGYLKLTTDSLVEATEEGKDERSIDPGQFHELLDAEFGLSYPE